MLPEYTYRDQELAPLYADYRQESYNRQRIAVEPSYAGWVTVGSDPELWRVKTIARTVSCIVACCGLSRVGLWW